MLTNYERGKYLLRYIKEREAQGDTVNITLNLCQCGVSISYDISADVIKKAIKRQMDIDKEDQPYDQNP